ncbi:HAD hydrolase-like protein [Streptomyces sp. NPDC005146]
MHQTLRLAIVSDVSEEPIWTYLKGHVLQSKIEIVAGRDLHELRHMKPDPYAVAAAVRHMDLAPSECLLVGGQLTDL